MRWLAFVAFASLGCTANNPNYVGSQKDMEGIVIVPDLAHGTSPTDLATSGGSHDLAGSCTASERNCATMPAVASEACEKGVFAVDRRCPFGTVTGTGTGGGATGAGASCMSGYCAPPTTGTVTNCDTGTGPTDRTCVAGGNMGPGAARRTCDPFVNPTSRAISWRCALPATATGATAGIACTVDSDCRNGLCAANNHCFGACLIDTDCATSGQKCVATSLVVEGVTIDNLKSCAAP